MEHLASVIAVLPPPLSQTIAACDQLTMRTQKEVNPLWDSNNPVWDNNNPEQQTLRGTLKDEQYKGWFHVFAVFIEDRNGNKGPRFWYRDTLKFENDTAWKSNFIKIADTDLIEIKVVAIEPRSAANTLSRYWFQVANSRATAIARTTPVPGAALEPVELPIGDSFPRDITVCSTLTIHGRTYKSSGSSQP